MFDEQRRFLNPRFEQYKLQPGASVKILKQWEIKQFKSPDTLNYKESKWRAGYNHLVGGKGSVAWIDPSGVVWQANPLLRQLVQLPMPAANEYPSVISVAEKLWVLTEGNGTLYLYDDQLKTGNIQFKPFKLHNAQLRGESVEVIISVLEQAYTIHRLRVSLTGHIEILWSIASETWPYPTRLVDDLSFLGTTRPLLPESANRDAAAKPIDRPQYSWTQDDDTCSLTFTGVETKDDVQVVFTPQFLTVKPYFVHQPLWSDIDPASSTWTFERDQKLLIVHVDKLKPAKWASIFKDENAPAETLSEERAKELASVLSHMTTENPEALNFQTSTLLGEGTDAEIDSSASDDMTYIASVDATGLVVDSYGPFEVISKPISAFDADNSLVIKRDVDGLYLDSNWEHASLYPALNYILASKRSFKLRHVLHRRSEFCLAIESPGNVWIYRPPPPGSKETAAVQMLVRLPDELGSVLGCAYTPGMGVVLLAEGGLMALEGVAK